ncbi:MAG TPA: TetR/AcrR family transcriptional regulator [Candidatus Dormibacteraeota bacterium]
MSNENRERILQAALTVLSREGYENTSIKAIAEEAGVAQGLIHYYFKSKQQLVVAALLVCLGEMKLDLAEAADVPAAFDKLRRSLVEDAAFHRFFVEMIGVGLHDPQLGAGVLEFIKTERQLAEQIGSRVTGGRLDATTLRSLAAVVWAANLGIIVQNLIDPDFDANAAVDALTLMAGATLGQLTGAPAPAATS